MYLTSWQKQSQDATKLADAFYDSLEGLLQDLRTVTMVSTSRWFTWCGVALRSERLMTAVAHHTT